MRVPLRHALVVSAAGAWLLVFAGPFVSPGNYGIWTPEVPPEPLAAVRLHLSRTLFHLAHAAQIAIAAAALCMLIQRRNRSWSAGIAFVISGVFVTLGLVIGTYPNVGLPFAYYGKFNRIQSVLNQCSDFKVIGSWFHRDLSLEDFGFTLQEPDGGLLKLEFDGALSYAELKASLPERCR